MVLPKRQWKNQTHGQVDGRKFRFRFNGVGHFMVMSYNVLAPFYGTEEKFHLTDPQHLDWDYRRRKILDEIIFYSPDFVCLQVIFDF